MMPAAAAPPTPSRSSSCQCQWPQAWASEGSSLPRSGRIGEHRHERHCSKWPQCQRPGPGAPGLPVARLQESGRACPAWALTRAAPAEVGIIMPVF